MSEKYKESDERFDTVFGMEQFVEELKAQRTRLLKEQKFLLRVLDYITER